MYCMDDKLRRRCNSPRLSFSFQIRIRCNSPRLSFFLMFQNRIKSNFLNLSILLFLRIFFTIVKTITIINQIFAVEYVLEFEPNVSTKTKCRQINIIRNYRKYYLDRCFKIHLKIKIYKSRSLCLK